MLNFNDISLENKEEIETLLKEHIGNDSEFTFTNLFIWRKSYHTQYTVIDNIPCFVYRHTGYPSAAAIPVKLTGDKELESNCINAAKILYTYFTEKNEECNLYIFDENLAKKIEEAFSGKVTYSEDEDSFDYVYSVEELTNLSGKRFHSKKNHVNKFKKLYNWKYEPITSYSAEECFDVFDRWCRLKGDEKASCGEEREAVGEILTSWDFLNVTGGCLRVDDKMVAFSVGEPLNKNMAVIHFEYADIDYEGSFPMMNQQFLINQWQDFEYVNREEDMGIAGMRKAKQSYHPIFLVKKYIVEIK